MDINPDPGCYRTTDSDIPLGSSPGPDDTVNLGYPHGYWLVQTLVICVVTDINTDLSCDRIKERHGPGSLRGVSNLYCPLERAKPFLVDLPKLCFLKLLKSSIK